jgi:hypothetical protein
MDATAKPASQAVSVLIDTCVDSHSDRAVGAEFVQKLKWGDRIQEFKVAAIAAEPILPNEHAWLQSQIDCLPTIGRLARQSMISALTYTELRLETFRRPGSVLPPLSDEFSGIEFKDVDAAIERSRLFSAGIDEYTKKVQSRNL